MKKECIYRANGLHAVDGIELCRRFNVEEKSKPKPVPIAYPTLTSTYKNDYRPIEYRSQCEKIEEPSPKEKWTIINQLCKCGKKRFNPDYPRICNGHISEYKDILSRTGYIIMKDRLHDHRKCGRPCEHMYTFNCGTRTI